MHAVGVFGNGQGKVARDRRSGTIYIKVWRSRTALLGLRRKKLLCRLIINFVRIRAHRRSFFAERLNQEYSGRAYAVPIIKSISEHYYHAVLSRVSAPTPITNVIITILVMLHLTTNSLRAYSLGVDLSAASGPSVRSFLQHPPVNLCYLNKLFWSMHSVESEVTGLRILGVFVWVYRGRNFEMRPFSGYASRTRPIGFYFPPFLFLFRHPPSVPALLLWDEKVLA